jgi:sterol desaturase/sphingolipid hydroxylase (fatty acid hydroxylase superfamily)
MTLAYILITSLTALITVVGGYHMSREQGYDVDNSKFKVVAGVGMSNFVSASVIRNATLYLVCPIHGEFDIFSLFNYILVYDLCRFLTHLISHLFDMLQHRRHHAVKYPTPFASAVKTVKDVVFIESASVYIALHFVEVGIAGFCIATVLMHAHDVMRHGACMLPYEGFLMGQRDHALHHYWGYGNYGFLFPWWDDVCGTRKFRGDAKILKHYNKDESTEH